MKKTLFVLFLSAFSLTVFAQDAKQLKRERIQASYMLALGRSPQEAEITYWQGRADANTIADIVKNHKAYLLQDAGTRRMVTTRSYIDILGRVPTQGELDYWSKSSDDYSDLTQKHIQWLNANPAEYEKVIKGSYQFVMGRQPAATEIAYWKSQGIHSYMMLVGCHEDWKRKNGAAAPKTSGVSTLATGSSYVVLVPISPLVANEARSFSGLVAAGGGNLVAAGGGNLVAAGGGNLVAAGGGNLVAAGGGN